VVAITGTSGSLASAGNVGPTTSSKLVAVVPRMTRTTFPEPSSSCARDGGGTPLESERAIRPTSLADTYVHLRRPTTWTADPVVTLLLAPWSALRHLFLGRASAANGVKPWSDRNDSRSCASLEPVRTAADLDGYGSATSRGWRAVQRDRGMRRSENSAHRYEDQCAIYLFFAAERLYRFANDRPKQGF
jgi:hypothetical protein